jgi:hypothetical protein
MQFPSEKIAPQIRRWFFSDADGSGETQGIPPQIAISRFNFSPISALGK